MTPQSEERLIKALEEIASSIRDLVFSVDYELIPKLKKLSQKRVPLAHKKKPRRK